MLSPYLHSVVLDFTGNHLFAIQQDPDCKSATLTITLDVELLPDKDGRRQSLAAEPGRQKPACSATAMLIKGFPRLLPLLISEPEIIRHVWQIFFQTNADELRDFMRNRSIIALLPTEWVPLISSCLTDAFGQVFKGTDLNICTEAAALLFSGLTRMESSLAAMGPNEESYLLINILKNKDKKAPCHYRLTKRKETLVVSFSGWCNTKDKSVTGGNDHRFTFADDNFPGMTAAYLGYRSMIEYLGKSEMPRVDLAMDMILGIELEQGEFLPLLDAEGGEQIWFGRDFKIGASASHLGVTLSAAFSQSPTELLPLGRLCLEFPEIGAEQRPEFVRVEIRMISPSLAEGMISLHCDNAIRQQIISLPLPRLYC